MKIIIEDHVVPQLITSALEAYDIEHRSSTRGKAQNKLETIGLLWGYVLPERDGHEKRVVATMATVETSALRTKYSAQPDIDSLQLKKEFLQAYWPQLELVGTFHSHPYETPEEVNDIKGWRLSTKEDVEKGSGCDEEFFPWFHENFMEDFESSAHLIVTVAAMKNKGSALPSRLKGEKEMLSGYVFNHGDRKLWLRGYGVAQHETEEEFDYELVKYPTLEIPSLIYRFNK